MWQRSSLVFLCGIPLLAAQETYPAVLKQTEQLAVAGKLEAAILSARHALQLKATGSEAHYWLGRLLFRKGTFAEAETCLRRAQELGVPPTLREPLAKLIQQLPAKPTKPEPPKPAPPLVPAPLTVVQYKAQLVAIPGGRFQMGGKEGNPDKQPIHWVTAAPFKLGKTPVTVGMFKEFCAATKHPMPDPPAWGWIDDHPMVNVSWVEAKAMGDWAGLRLPTEAEWEFAARGGEPSLEFPWGDTYNDTLAWSSVNEQRDRTAPVSRRENIYTNPYGLTDMVGNVFEWCADWYAADYYSRSTDTNPTGPETGEFRVLRGGSWYSYTTVNSFRNSGRASSHPTGRVNSDGFRLAQSLP